MANPRGNPATLRPPFTPETARAFAIAYHTQRKADRERAKTIQLLPEPTSDDARKALTLSQIDKLDVLINAALDKQDADLFLRLSSAKERLWKLVSPTAGVMRPNKRGSGDSRRPSIAPVASDQTPQAPADPAGSEPQG